MPQRACYLILEVIPVVVELKLCEPLAACSGALRFGVRVAIAFARCAVRRGGGWPHRAAAPGSMVCAHRGAIFDQIAGKEDIGWL